MTIAPVLQKYLADHEVAYDLIPHQPTQSSLRTAEASHIPGDCLVKGVVVRDPESYWLAVLPASRHIRLPELKTELGRDVELAGFHRDRVPRQGRRTHGVRHDRDGGYVGGGARRSRRAGARRLCRECQPLFSPRGRFERLK